MIGIKINNEFLDLFPDTQISLKLNNPIFADGNVIPGSYSLPFTIPFGESSPLNSRIFNHYDVVENTDSLRKYPAEIYIDHLLFKKGIIVINSWSADTLSINFQFGLGSFADDFKAKSIRDIVREEVILYNLPYTKEIRIHPINEIFHSITISGKLFAENFIQDMVDSINEDEDINVDAEYFVNGWDGGGDPDDYVKLTPRNNADSIESPLSVEVDLTRWEVTTNVNAYMQAIKSELEPYLLSIKPDNRFRFPMLFNYGKYPLQKLRKSSEIENALGYVNNQSNESFKGNEITQSNFSGYRISNRCDLQPFVKLSHIFDKLNAIYGIEFDGGFFNSEAYSEALIYSTKSLNIPVEFLGGIDFHFWEPRFNIADLVPDIKISEFLKALQTRFNLAISYNEFLNVISINYRDDILIDPSYIDITHICSPILSLEDISAGGIRLEAEKDENDEEAIDDIYEDGISEITISSPISGLNRELTAIYSGRMMPYSNQLESDKFRLIFYKGQKSDNNTALYDQSRIFIGVEMESSFISHIYDGLDGLVVKIWTKYLRFLKARKQTSRDIIFEFSELQAIDWIRKYRVGEVNYFLKSIDVILTNKGIRPCRTELFSIF